MAIKKEEFEAMIEREGVMDFIWARSWEDVPGTEIGLYQLANDRWGTIFQIFPPVYAGSETEKRLSTFYRMNLPDKTSIQMFAFSSRNVTAYRNAYKALHSTPGIIEEREVMRELAENREEWIRTFPNKSLFKRGIDFRLRNFINLCAITIPTENTNGFPFSKSEVVNVFSRVYTGLSDFRPKKFDQREYVRVMREIFVPDEPLWKPPLDTMTFLNAQIVDADSTIVIEEDTATLGIGKMISKKKFDEIQQKDLADIKEEEEEDLGFFQSLFSKKKKRKKKDTEERTAYTEWHAKVFTTKMFPSSTNLFKMLSKFYDFFGGQIEPEVPCPFFANLTVYIENKEKIKKEVFEKTQWNLWQTNSLGQAVRFFPEIGDRAAESEAINILINDGEVPMYAVWSVVVMDNSLMKTQQYGERLRKRFMEDNWILQEETIIPHWMFLYSLPLQFEPFVLKQHSKRMSTLFTSNCSAITPLMTGERGYGEPVLLYVDRAGQLSGVDIFSSETNYNFIVIGSSGSGKSYTMADFFTNYLMRGAKIRVIDVGRSYKHLCDLIGGQYIEFTEEANVCLNFFTNIALDKHGKIADDELQTIVPLIALMAMQSINPEDVDNNIQQPVLAGYISQAVTMAYNSRQRNAGMEDVVIALELIRREQKNEGNEPDKLLADLIIALYPFGNPNGEYYRYFNGPNNLKFRSDFVVLELEEIDSKDHLKSVVLAAIAHAINTEFFLGNRDQPKILAIDEAWSIMDNKIVVRFLETMARRIRKYNGASGIITQTIGDFFKNKATRAIFDSSAMKFFLQQSPESIHAAKNKGELTLDDGLIELMTTVKSKPPLYSEILVKQDNGAYFIGRLITDRVAHWVYTNHPKDMKEIRTIMKNFGISEVDAKMIKGYSEKNETTIEEEYNKRLKAGKLSNIKQSKSNELTASIENL